MKIIDARNLPCPQPVILVKRNLEEGEKEFKVIVNREDALQNILRFCSSKGAKASWNKVGEDYQIDIEVSEKLCSIEAKEKNLRMFISSDRIGKGSEELGLLLMKSFLNTLLENRDLPEKVILMNSGVLLACQEDTSLSLRKLEEKGVEILVCGTCLKFYQKESELKAGRVSNMYEITENLIEGRVLTI